MRTRTLKNITERRCTCCNTVKPRSDFYEVKGKDRPTPACRACWSKRYGHTAERSRIRRLYGISLEDYHDRISAAGGLCEGCGRSEPRVAGSTRKPKSLGLDHCHRTGKPRGVLCTGCNLILGYAGDDPGLLRKLADYLEKYG